MLNIFLMVKGESHQQRYSEHKCMQFFAYSFFNELKHLN